MSIGKVVLFVLLVWFLWGILQDFSVALLAALLLVLFGYLFKHRT